MKKIILRMLREVRANFGQFISIVLIIAVGAMLMSGMFSSIKAMDHSVNHYYEQQNMANLWIYYQGIQEEEVQSFFNREEVAEAEGRYTLNEVIALKEQEVTLRFHSLTNINKPLLTQGTLGYSERIHKKELSKEKQQLYISIVYNQAKDMEAIVNEFEEYIGANVLNRRQLQIYSICYMEQMLNEEYVSWFQLQNGILTIHNQCRQNTAVEVELLKMRRVFANIFGNAIKHSKAASVHVLVQIYEKESKVYFIIEDDGKGVSESELEYLFEPFYTSDQSRQISGLGLSICKQIIEGHDGTIEVYINQKGGLSVEFGLPQCKI